MPYLLNLIYVGLVVLLSPYLLFTAVRKGKYRAGWAEKWLGRVACETNGRRCIWLHAVSVGEVNLLAPLVKALERAYPEHALVISTTSRTGQELAKKKYAAHCVCYAPLDFSWAVNAALQRLRPELLILAELELWPNLVWAAKRHGAKVVVFNGRLSDRSFRGYRWIRPLLKSVLRAVDCIAAQSEQYAERFIALGADAARVHVTGSVKFDGAETNRDNPRTRKLAELANITTSDTVFLAGSTQAPEEQLALETYLALRDSHPELLLILVPRHPERFAEVAELLQHSGVAWARRSELGQAGNRLLPRVLLVDVVGELGAWWGLATIGFIGGSLLNRRGGQNMLEPAAYGTAIAFGPNTANFRDIVTLMRERDAAVVVHSGEELTSFVQRALADEAWSHELSCRARQLVSEHLGATERTLQLLTELVPPGRQSSRQAA
ncbi:MAG TPA: 3-deoxy-D-manno-octulosonic acid transferase [Pirellulaceae bacterium]|nr:3-deoxy-D-manno-octulosonic acid transferase [Pirellulaceae bacterium]